MTRRILVVCTANVCRSPIVQRLLERGLEHSVDPDGESWEVSSAGTTPVEAEVDQATIDAGSRAGLAITGHTRTLLESSLLTQLHPDLVLTMTREHLRAVVAVDPALWPRTFTLKELARKAQAGIGSSATSFDEWRAAMSSGRRAAEMIMPDAADDVDDPYGGPRRGYDDMIAETAAAVGAILKFGPWRAPGRPSGP